MAKNFKRLECATEGVSWKNGNRKNEIHNRFALLAPN